MRLKSSIQLISAIALVSTLSLMSGVPLLQTAAAAPTRQTNEVTSYAYPKSLSWRVRQDLARRVGIPARELRVTEAKRRTWNDACLELAAADEFCGQQLVDGWRVVVAHSNQSWVYHTDAQGRSLRLEAANDLKPALPKNVVFRSLTTGGFAGQTYETVLFADGRIHQRFNLNGKTAPVQMRRLSAEQVRQFQELLSREQFDRFDQKNYTATPGAADFLVVTLTSPAGTVQYADSEQSKLPRSLKTIVEAWNALR